jgi:hypothetical protein
MCAWRNPASMRRNRAVVIIATMGARFYKGPGGAIGEGDEDGTRSDCVKGACELGGPDLMEAAAPGIDSPGGPANSKLDSAALPILDSHIQHPQALGGEPHPDAWQSSATRSGELDFVRAITPSFAMHQFRATCASVLPVAAATLPNTPLGSLRRMFPIPLPSGLNARIEIRFL